MQNIDIVFFIEHKDRELDSILAIRRVLKKKYNISSIVLHKHFHLHFLNRYRPKICIVPYFLSKEYNPASFIHDLYGDTVIYVSYNWEQLLTYRSKLRKKIKSEYTKKKVIQFIWNKSYIDFLLENGVLNKNIKITGNIAQELLFNLKNKKDNFRKFFSKKYGINKNKKWLFMPMNYGWAFFSDRKINKIMSIGDIYAEKFKKYSRKCFIKYIKFIRQVAERFNNLEIIIRPHPLISNTLYIKQLTKGSKLLKKNIYINKDLTVKEWIVASDYIGSSWSTSVYDAYLLGKQVFFFTPIKRPIWYDTDWLNQISNIKTIEELGRLLKGPSPQFNQSFLQKDNATQKTALELKLLLTNFKNIPLKKVNSPFSLKRIKDNYIYFSSYISMKYFKKSLFAGFEFDYFKEIGIKNNLIKEVLGIIITFPLIFSYMIYQWINQKSNTI